MDDSTIIGLYFDRSEEAIAQTRIKYGAYLHGIAIGILRSLPDAEECENDTYLSVWNAIPPDRPNLFSAYLAKITRNLALNRLRAGKAQKRGGASLTLSLEELSDCIDGGTGPEQALDEKELASAIDSYLRSLPEGGRILFLRRYFFLHPVNRIASDLHLGKSAVKMRLLRMRSGLKEHLIKEGILK